MIGTNEIIVIALVVLVLFGASAVPKFARSLGRAKREFEKGIKDKLDEEKDEAEDEADAPEK